MSKMPEDRTSEWNGIFQRFGTLDGGRRQRPALEPQRPSSKTDFDLRNGPSAGSLPQVPQPGRTGRK